ncbi:MAG: hypothetical protein P1U32_01650 [Legionellaceae bacterium]|nr:hypothetical protein [Legionellaceae bacterium]
MNKYFQGILLSLSAILTFSSLIWALHYCSYGFDLTDEGFYLLSIKHPEHYTYTFSLFGFIYHPFYELFSGNLSLLRQVNILALFIPAFSAFYIFFKNSTFNLNTWSCVVIAAAAASTVLNCLYHWLPTPNYNTLEFQALLICLNALLLIDTKKISPKIAIGWLLLAIGGWLSFMAKTTSTLMLALVTLIYLGVARRFYLPGLLITIITAVILLTVSIIGIDHSLPQFITRFQSAIEIAQTLSNNYGFPHLFRLDLPTSKQDIYIFLPLCLYLLLAYLMVYTPNRTLNLSGVILTLSAGLLGFAIIIANLFSFKTNLPHLLSVLLAAMPSALLLFALVVSPKKILKINHSRFALAFVCLSFPYVYAFGTSNSYFYVAAHAGLFWVLFGYLVMEQSELKSTPFLIAVSIITQVIIILLVNQALYFPYRQIKPLAENTFPLTINEAGHKVLVADEYGEYLSSVIKSAKQASFSPGTPMIDMSGKSPGMLYLLGADNVGAAWLLGGRPGSNPAAVKVLRTVPCEILAQAWLFREPNGPRSLDDSILSSFGASIKDYETVAVNVISYNHPAEYPKDLNQKQEILKPKRPLQLALNKCITTRNLANTKKQ